MDAVGAHGGEDAKDRLENRLEGLADESGNLSDTDDVNNGDGEHDQSDHELQSCYCHHRKSESPHSESNVGSCIHPNTHTSFPSASRWCTEHMDRFRFEVFTFDADWSSYVSDEEVICHWLINNSTAVDTSAINKFPAYPATPEVDAAIVLNSISKSQYRRILSRYIETNLQEDGFIRALTEFSAKYDMKSDLVQSLVKATMMDGLDDTPAAHRQLYRSALLRWVSSFKAYRKAALTESHLAQVLAELINIAAYDAQCTLLVQFRECTSRKLLLCGQYIEVLSDVEVQSPDGQVVLQVIVCSENKGNQGDTAMTKLLPKISCEALAAAEVSPFCNDFYKTVYQVAVLSVFTDSESDEAQLYAFLVKCYVSTETLEDMSMCPMGDCHKSSYIMHSKYACGNFQDCKFVAFVYKAVKAAILAFQGVEGTRSDLNKK
ncbi:uncharacterized protein [Ptychodera flava]|uniref:uncharacterized protein n=1 Tax=Ptychodera flava TaxID=63121 RepID=UPI00396AB139